MQVKPALQRLQDKLPVCAVDESGRPYAQGVRHRKPERPALCYHPPTWNLGTRAELAQLAERRLPKPNVAGSNPVLRSIFPPACSSQFTVERVISGSC